MLLDMERGLFGRRPLLVTRDEMLIDAVQRLSAVAGVELQLETEGRGSWSSAPLVLIGSDAVSSLVSMHLARRSGVIVIGVGAPVPPSGAGQAAGSEQLWRDAVAIGAEHVISLPDADSWLIQRLGEAADGPSRDGQLVAVLGATGGAGASTLSIALGVAAQEVFERSIVIDGDHLAGGLDLLMGAELMPGVRWPDLADARGRLSADTLDHALAHPQGVALLSHARPQCKAVSDDVALSVIDASLRGYDRVIVDLDGTQSAIARVALERASDVVLLIPSSVRGIAAALARRDELRELPARLHPVLRLLPKGIGLRDSAQALGGNAIIGIPDSPAVVARANQGDATLPNDAFGKAVRQVLAAIQPTLARSA